MKFRLLLLPILFILSFQGIAQKKQLTLEDAIINRYGDLAPDRLEQLQWLANDHVCSYVKDNQLYKNYTYGLEKKLFKLDDLNKLLGDSLKSFPYMTWVKNNALSFYYKGDNITINDKARKILARVPVPKKGSNFDYCKENGTYAFTKENNLWLSKGKDEIAITQDEDKNHVYGQSVSRNEFGISGGTFWSPKGNFLAFYKKDESKVSNYPLVDYMGRVAEHTPIKYPMAGMPSEHVEVGIYSMITEKTMYLQKQGEPEDYMTNLTWSLDEKYLFVQELNRAQNHMKLNQYDAITGRFIKTVLEEKHPTYVEPQHPLFFLPNEPNEFFMFSNWDGYARIMHYNTDGKFIRQLTKGDWEVTRFVGYDAGEELLYVEGTKDSPLERHLYKINVRNGDITKITHGSGVHYTTISPDNKYFIDHYQSTDIPNVTTVISNGGKKLRTLNISNDNAADYQFGENKIIELPCKDGKNTLYARIILPPNFDATKKYPVILYVYGGPHSQLITRSWKNSARWWQYYMAQKGYIAFTLDNRGTPNRGRDFETVIHRQLGVHEMEDQMTGIEYLKSLPYVDAERIGVHGWSFGGFMTTNLILTHPDTFKVGVAGGPVIDWSMYEVMYGERYMDTPQENPEGYENSNLLNKVQNLEGRLLIIHGVQDPTVVMQHSMKFLRKCVKEGKQVDFFAYPTHPHNVRGKDRVHLMEKVSRYFEDNL
ncbi:prolyl tripeptidyl peptidase [Balneicella halophila]|uniref:Prolyl tripeptidyl peptidase n=1 Tax=Balneicella halophila TaxID=1537566 RepID=A0A7L4UQS2_BALHA|nr:DPP IV N-terminal domain-containing protein [Balneicella halophila]PVX52019.1 prolyl tripeptidyl peptidase [Balneicella halophila]